MDVSLSVMTSIVDSITLPSSGVRECSTPLG
jgi:hypothetical protein